MSLLTIDGLRAGYGAGDVLKDVSLHVDEGECVAVLGANGAGKTSLLRAISGLMARSAGALAFGGQALPAEPCRVAARGIAHVPEGRGTIPGLSVEENLLVGAYLQKDKKQIRRDVDEAFARFPVLQRYRRRQAVQLSGGEQQMLAISRALMSHPRLLLLDEPSFGLAPKIVSAVYGALQGVLQERRIAVVLVEQSAELAMRAARRAYVLKHGKVAGTGNAAEMLHSDELRQMYLGRDAERA